MNCKSWKVDELQTLQTIRVDELTRLHINYQFVLKLNIKLIDGTFSTSVFYVLEILLSD